MLNNKTIFSYLPLFFSLVLFTVFRFFFFSQTGDDSYIYFRYVDRALAGYGWSWSGHIPPVEGYSSPLWYFLLIIAGKLGMPVILAARILGAFFSLLTLAGAWVLARELKASIVLSGLCCLLLVSSHGFNYWATAGLETSLYAALLVWSCIGIIRERFWLLPTSFLGMARPEGVFLLLAILACMFIFKRQKFSVISLIACFLPALAWMITRFLIYGDWLPNTFYAKATGNSVDQLINGTAYCIPVLLPVALSWLFWWKDKHQPTMIALGMSTMLMGIVLLGGGDWMFHFRLLIPLYAIVFAVMASQWPVTRVAGKIAMFAVLIPLLSIVVPPGYIIPAFQGDSLPMTDYQEGSMTSVSLDLASLIAERYPEPLLIAVNHAGALPWALPGYDVIDMVGLNDAHIARQQGKLHQKYDVDYVLGLKPQLIVLNSRVRPGTNGVWYHKGYWSGEDALVSHPDFTDYQATDMVFSWRWHVPFPYSLVVRNAETSWIMVFERKPGR